jgi:hypothetical protein
LEAGQRCWWGDRAGRRDSGSGSERGGAELWEASDGLRELGFDGGGGIGAAQERREGVGGR